MDQLDFEERRAGWTFHRRRRSDALYRPPQNETCGQGGTHLGNPPAPTEDRSESEGIPPEVWDGFRAGLTKDPSQFYKDFAVLFYGANRPGAKVSQGLLDQTGY